VAGPAGPRGDSELEPTVTPAAAALEFRVEL
jgi:hypothetical protein